MYNEKFSKNVMEGDVMNLSDSSNELRNGKFIGEVIDTAIDAKTGERTVIGHYHNLVVDSCSVLIASLIKGTGKGVQYLAVGSGASSWSNSALPEPTAGDTKLLAETFRKVVNASDIKFIDALNAESASATNRLQITVTFLENEANGELRELGFFGGNATATKDSGILINRKIHGLIYKTSGMRLERVIRFTF